MKHKHAQTLQKCLYYHPIVYICDVYHENDESM